MVIIADRLNQLKNAFVHLVLRPSNLSRETISSGHDIDFVKSYEKRLSESVLHRLWKHACIMSWIIFASYEIAIQCDYVLSENPLCPNTDQGYPVWYFEICYGVFGGYILILLMLLGKVFNSTSSRERIPFLIALNIVCLGTLGKFLELIFNWGGICIDTLGVATPAGIWGEWFGGGPLLIFICLSLLDKPDLAFYDYLYMISFLLCLVFGFLIIIPQPFWLAVTFLVLSCVSFLPVLVLPFYVTRSSLTRMLFYTKKVHSNDDEENQNQSNHEEMTLLHSKRRSLCIFLAIFLPIFTINYFFVYFKLYGYDVGISIFQIFSVLTKGLFSTLCMDIHVDALKDIQNTLVGEKNKTATRLTFLKYIFHEMRTPLSSINMGISILNDSNKMSESDQNVLEMIESAANFLEDTLDKSLEMQEVLEGTIKLNYSPFKIKACVDQILHTVWGDAAAKHITLLDDVSLSTQSFLLLGDYYRIEYVIGNLLNNAIKFSDENTSITIAVTCGEPIQRHSEYISNNNIIERNVVSSVTNILITNDENSETGITANLEKQFISLTVTVIDQGFGISDEAQKTLFNNLDLARPDNIQSGQGSGVGLPLCKKIIELHNGSINAKSVLGKGSTFSFTIPFEVVGNQIEASAKSFKPRNATFTLPNRSRRESVGLPFALVNSDSRSSLASRLISPMKLKGDSCTASEQFFSLNVQQKNTSVLNSIIRTKSYDSLSKIFSGTTPHTSSSYRDVEESKQNTEHSSQSFLCIINTLVVEDMESTRKLFKKLLKNKGVDAVLAEDGKIAVDIVLKNLNSFQLILMDNIMPNMNGVCAARAMRAAGHKNLIIGVTGNVLNDEIDEFLDAGADLIIKKPLKSPILQRLLDFIKTNGSLSMHPVSKIIDDGSTFVWKK